MHCGQFLYSLLSKQYAVLMYPQTVKVRNSGVLEILNSLMCLQTAVLCGVGVCLCASALCCSAGLRARQSMRLQPTTNHYE